MMNILLEIACAACKARVQFEVDAGEPMPLVQGHSAAQNVRWRNSKIVRGPFACVNCGAAFDHAVIIDAACHRAERGRGNGKRPRSADAQD